MFWFNRQSAFCNFCVISLVTLVSTLIAQKLDPPYDSRDRPSVITPVQANFFTLAPEFNTTLNPKPLALTRWGAAYLQASRLPVKSQIFPIPPTFFNLEICDPVSYYDNRTSILCTEILEAAVLSYCRFCVNDARSIEMFLDYHTAVRNGTLIPRLLARYYNISESQVNKDDVKRIEDRYFLPTDPNACDGGYSSNGRHYYCFCNHPYAVTIEATCRYHYLRFKWFMLFTFPPIATSIYALILIIYTLIITIPDSIDLLKELVKKAKDSSLSLVQRLKVVLVTLFRMRTVIQWFLFVAIVAYTFAFMSNTIMYRKPETFPFLLYNISIYVGCIVLLVAYGLLLVFWMSVLDSTDKGTKAKLSCKHIVLICTLLGITAALILAACLLAVNYNIVFLCLGIFVIFSLVFPMGFLFYGISMIIVLKRAGGDVTKMKVSYTVIVFAFFTNRYCFLVLT